MITQQHKTLHFEAIEQLQQIQHYNSYMIALRLLIEDCNASGLNELAEQKEKEYEDYKIKRNKRVDTYANLLKEILGETFDNFINQ